LLLLRQLNRT